MSETDVAAAAQVPLGDPVSTLKLDDARRRIVDWYKELGYYYVDVKYALEPSARQHARARALRRDSRATRSSSARSSSAGSTNTRESVVRRRIALAGRAAVPDERRPARRRSASRRSASSRASPSASATRTSRRRTRTSSSTWSSGPATYLELELGFSTGEGVRGDARVRRAEHLRLRHRRDLPRAALVPAGLPHPRPAGEAELRAGRRTSLARRDHAELAWSRTWASARSCRADRRRSTCATSSATSRSTRSSALGPHLPAPERGAPGERSAGASSTTTSASSSSAPSSSTSAQPAPTAHVGQLGVGVAAPRAGRRQHRRRGARRPRVGPAGQRVQRPQGTYVVLGAELVELVPGGQPVQAGTNIDPSSARTLRPPRCPRSSQPAPQAKAHFVRLTQTFAGYLPISARISFAAELRLGENVHTAVVPSTPTRTREHAVRPTARTPIGSSSWAASTRCAAGCRTRSCPRSTPTDRAGTRRSARARATTAQSPSAAAT